MRQFDAEQADKPSGNLTEKNTEEQTYSHIVDVRKAKVLIDGVTFWDE